MWKNPVVRYRSVSFVSPLAALVGLLVIPGSAKTQDAAAPDTGAVVHAQESPPAPEPTAESQEEKVPPGQEPTSVPSPEPAAGAQGEPASTGEPVGVGALRARVVQGITGQPLAGATVQVVGTSFSCITQDDGQCTIDGVPAGTREIRVYLRGYGFEKSNVAVAVGLVADVPFVLARRDVDLEEIVITGTAKATARREIGTSIGVLRVEDLTARPIVSLDDVLSASVSGVTLLQGTGMAGAAQALRIRGVHSVTRGNAPLVYIDGMRMENIYYTPALDGSQQASSTLNDINPNDIDRIEIIKGSAATTLYGTEAAGGVIQIFTKSGRGIGLAKPVWDLKITQGVNNLRTLWGPREPSAAWYERYGEESKGLWLDQWKKNGYFQDYNLSVRGATRSGSYFLSGRWMGDEGVLPEQWSKEWSLRGNTTFSLLDSLDVTFNNALNRRNVSWIADGDYARGFLLNVMRHTQDRTGDQDERVFKEQDYVDLQTHVMSSLQFSFIPDRAFDFRLTLGFDLADLESIAVRDYGSFSDATGNRAVRRYHNETRTLDFRANFIPELTSWLTSTTSVGVEVHERNNRNVWVQASNFVGLFEVDLDSGGAFTANESRSRQINAGFFAQELLGIHDKLFITAGLRVDGHSAFGKDFGLQPFPKLSASYVISEESFWPAMFDATKIRVAYGESGKAPGIYDAVASWDTRPFGGGSVGVVPANVGNPNLGPERTREFEGGVESSALDGRINLDASVYYQRTVDALLFVPQDPTLGYPGGQLDNVGTLDNWGAEIALTGTPVRHPDVVWNLGVTVSTNKSKVVDLHGTPEIDLGSDQYVREGYPIAAYFAQKLINPKENGDPALTPATTYIGPVYPTHTFNITTSAVLFDNLTVELRGEYLGGHYLASGVAYQNSRRGLWPRCYDAYARMEAGDWDGVTALERWRCGSNTTHDAHIYKADFFRLRNASLSYQLPREWLGGLKSITLVLAGTNLYTFTRYGGLDPETHEANEGGFGGLVRREYYNLPPIRRFTLSLRGSY